MKKILIILLALLCAGTFELNAADKAGKAKKNKKQEAKSFVFEQGDRIGFIGNSITHGGQYLSPIMLYYTTRMPYTEMDFFNIGLSGDRITGLNRRINSDILSHKPTVATVMIGMNDIRPEPFLKMAAGSPEQKQKIDEMLELYKENAYRLYDSLAAHTRQLILFTPSIYDQTQVNPKVANAMGKNDILREVGEFIKKTAPRYGAIVVDMWQGTQDVTLKMQAQDPTSSVLRNDRVHPGPLGGFVMAYRFLKDLGAPQYVSKVVIDSRKRQTTETVNCEVKDIRSDASGVTFTMKAGALPFPTNAETSKALEYIPFTDEFNREIIQVKGLGEGTYKLSISGTDVGSYTASELSEGVNLSTNSKTPQYRQAVRVMELCEKYRKDYNEYRQIVHGEFFRLDPSFTDYTNVEACIAEAEKALAKQKDPNGRIANAIRRYIRYKPNEQQMHDAVFDTAKEIYRINKPMEYTYVLVKE